MDGKTKKILNYLKKSGGGEEALDISFGLNMDEDFVQNALDSLIQANLITAARNEQGKVLYNPASGESAAEDASPVREKAPKKARSKAAAGPEDHFDEFVLENEAVNLATETIATHIDDITPKAAPVPPSVPPSTSVFEAAATPPSTSVFEAVTFPAPPSTSVFEAIPAPAPVPAPAPAPTPSTSVFEVEDDFAPKPKKVKKSAPPPDTGTGDDDFSPKPKKDKEKAAKFDVDTAHDDNDGLKPKASIIPALAISVVFLIAAVLLSVTLSDGKIKAAVSESSAEFVKASDFQAYKDETDAKITKLEGENKELTAKIESLKAEAKKTSADSKPTPTPTPKKKRR